jgi:putative membrane protein
VLRRTRRSVGVDRIQQVEIDRPLVQRLLGMATLRFDTAGSDAEPEVELRVLRHELALDLQRALQQDASPQSVAGADATPPRTDAVVLQLSNGRVALAAITGAQLLLAPAVLLGTLQLIGGGDEGVTWLVRRVEELVSRGEAMTATTATALVVATVVLMVATTLVVGVVRDGSFTVRRVDDDLVVRRGLLGTRESTLPLKRLQVVRVVANPLRRLLGAAAVRVHSAGGSGSGERRIVIPLIRDDQLPTLLAALLDTGAGSGAAAATTATPAALTASALRVELPTFVANPPQARRRSIARRLFEVGTLVVPLAIGLMLLRVVLELDGAPVLPALLTSVLRASESVSVVATVLGGLVVLAGILGTLDHRARGHACDAHMLAARAGALTRITSVAPRARLQAVSTRASLLQARRGLASVIAHVAGPGGDVVVIDIDASRAEALHVTLARSAAGASGIG